MDGLFRIFTVEKRDSNLPDLLWMKRGWKLVLDAAPGHPAQKRHELAAVAHAEAEGVRAVIELLELVPDLFVEPDGGCPALGGIEHVGITESAHEDNAAELVELDAAVEQVGHGHVPGLEPGQVRRPRPSHGPRCFLPRG